MELKTSNVKSRVPQGSGDKERIKKGYPNGVCNQSHKTHRMPVKTPRKTPRTSLKPMTISHTHHSIATRAHSKTMNPVRRIHRNRRRRLRRPLSRASLNCLTASVLVVLSWTHKSSASFAVARTRGARELLTRFSRFLSWDRRGDEVEVEKWCIECWNECWVCSKRRRRH